jgi:hypothetical protein
MENKLSGTVTISQNNLSNFTLNPPFGTTTSTHNLYSIPELIKAIIKDDTIELVYKRQYMVSLGYGMPNPEIYKDVYSRHGGDVRRVIGTYIPAQLESYEFEE